MTTINVTNALLVDLVPLAEELENAFQQYLIPAAVGFYLPGGYSPVMKDGGYYYQLIDGKPVAISSKDDIVSDVFNASHDIVVPKKRIRQLSYGPKLPVRGMDMVRKLVDHILDTNASWVKNHNETVIDVLTPFLNPDILAPNNREALNYVEKMTNKIIAGLRKIILDFVGEDHWIMHFQKEWGVAGIIIEKTIDYRIYDWQRRMESGEWTQ